MTAQTALRPPAFPIELLSPAGDMEKLRFAFAYGADAAYLACEDYGMRAAAKNFTLDALREAAALKNSLGKKIYLTLNTVPTNADIDAMPAFLQSLQQIDIDAVIVADLGVLRLVKLYLPRLPVHFSTQAGIVNYESARMAHELGASRVVLARELCVEDIAAIRRNTPPELELECFVHGAMCMSFSGRCLISHYLTGRDANRGACTQPCRWEYALVEKTRPRLTFDLTENQFGTYLMNADDLNMAEHIDALLGAGVTSLKIEGRAKSFYYVASTAAAYRRAIDAWRQAPHHYRCPSESIEELHKISHRPYSTGFYFGRENAVQTTDTADCVKPWTLLAVAEGEGRDGLTRFVQRGKMTQGDTVEILTPDGDVLTFTAGQIWNEEGQSVPSTPHAKMPFFLRVPMSVPPMSILRKKADG